MARQGAPQTLWEGGCTFITPCHCTLCGQQASAAQYGKGAGGTTGWYEAWIGTLQRGQMG